MIRHSPRPQSRFIIAPLPALASGGVTFSNMYAITDASQPNYLQFFTGSDQSIKNDNLSPTLNAPNLGALLIGGGKSFCFHALRVRQRPHE